MGTLWPTLVEFLFRLGTGLSAAMLLTSARQVTSGFFRIQSWVLMGLAVFASLVLYSQAEHYKFASLALGFTIAAAVVSYVSAVLWMYDASRAGKIALGLALLLNVASDTAADLNKPLLLTDNIDFATSSMILGSLLTAMLLGHWYLNFPGMKLEPLKLLVVVGGAAILARAMFAAAGVVQLALIDKLPNTTIDWSFLAFRWFAGLIAPGVMVWLTWETLKVPNTQSATGILYAAVTLVFLGELTSQLLWVGLLVHV